MSAPPALPRLERATDAASGHRFSAVTGPRAAAFGDERGVLEAWLWPMKIAGNVHVRAATAGTELVGPRCAQRVVSYPDRVEHHAAAPGLRVASTVFAAPDEPAIVFLVEVECESEVLLGLHFSPEVRPMWPAGLGGRIAAADAETGALVLREELGRFAALWGSPEAERAEVPEELGLPRELVVRVRVSPERAREGPVPFVLVGAEVEPEPPAPGAGRGEAVLERARARYRDAAASWPEWMRASEARWTEFLARTATLETPDPAVDEAFLWAKIAVERLWVDVPGVGRGLVAGLGPSGTGERPGFGWLFDGDALVATRAMAAYGDVAGARDVLRLAAGRQRADGKVMHELVLSARWCDWLGDYPYAYGKLGNTPGFLTTLHHHLMTTGDGAVLDELWEPARRAWELCLEHVDADDFLSGPRGRLDEAGPLAGRVRAEVFLQGIWQSAVSAMRWLARVRGEEELGRRADDLAARAAAAFEEFWNEDERRYGFALLDDGARCDDLSGFSAHPLSRGFGTEEHALAAASQLGEPRLAADWGVRFLAEDSELYDPEDYDTGSVFPYLTGFAVLALYRHGLVSGARQLHEGLTRLHSFSGLGMVPEHLYGDLAESPPRGVPLQLFSSGAVVQSTVYGMLGVATVAPENLLLLHPALPPDWDRVRYRGLVLGERTVDLELRRTRLGDRTRLELDVGFDAGRPLRVFFRPWLPPLTDEVALVLPDGRTAKVPCSSIGGALRPMAPGCEVTDRATITIEARTGPELELRTAAHVERERSRDPRIGAMAFDGERVGWTLWGPAGSAASLRVWSDRPLDFFGGEESDGLLAVRFPDPAAEPNGDADARAPGDGRFVRVAVGAALRGAS